MHVVRDGQRTLKFEGTELAKSSSHRKGKERWVEFRLYRTQKGQYVLSRVGMSLVYHTDTCPVVKRNDIYPVPAEAIGDTLVPCPDCDGMPAGSETLYPETPRYWAQKSDTAEGVVESLYQYDHNGSKYLTNVAKDLLTQASDTDPDIADNFYTEYL